MLNNTLFLDFCDRLFLSESWDGWLPDVLGEGSAGLALAEVGLKAWEFEVMFEVCLICKQLVKVVS